MKTKKVLFLSFGVVMLARKARILTERNILFSKVTILHLYLLIVASLAVSTFLKQINTLKNLVKNLLLMNEITLNKKIL